MHSGVHPPLQCRRAWCVALCFPCSSPLSQAFPAAAPPQISGRRWSFYCHHSFAPLECCAVGITQCVVFSWLLSLSSTLECMQASSCLFVSFDSLLFFKPYFLLANYFIRAVVGLQKKLLGQYREFSHSPSLQRLCFLSHFRLVVMWYICYNWWINTDTLFLSQLIRVHSRWCTFCGFWSFETDSLNLGIFF